MNTHIAESMCSVCGAQGPFVPQSPDTSLRETGCPECGASHGTRNVARAILSAVGLNWDKPLSEALDALAHLDILELADRGPLHGALCDLPGYQCCELLPDTRPGFRNASGTLCQDFTTLTFANTSFDLVISQDVLQYLPDPWPAFAETSRILKPGGKHIFTVPVHENLEASRCRTRKNLAGETAHIHPPVYHSSIADASGHLVHWDFGQDILQRLAESGITARESVSTRFYGISEISDLNDPGQYRRYEFLRKRNAISRAFRYNAVTFAADARPCPELSHRIRYAPETDPLQITIPSRVHSLAEQEAALAEIRSETVNWNGQNTQMVDLTVRSRDGDRIVIMLVAVFWGDFPTFVFPERFGAAHRFAESVAAQLRTFFMRLAGLYGEVPGCFHLDADLCDAVAPTTNEPVSPGTTAYATVIPRLRRYGFAAGSMDSSLDRVLDVGCGLGYGLNMMQPGQGVGVDVSEDVLRDAARAFPQNTLSWLHGSVGDVGLDATFDTVTCFGVMERLPDHIPLLDAITPWVDGKGTVFLSISNPSTRGKKHVAFHPRDASLDSLKALFSRYFSIVEWFYQHDDSLDLQRNFLVKPGALPEHDLWIAKCKAPLQPQSRPKVSVIMPVFNTWGNTGKAVAALAANTPRSLDWELVVIDDASTDETAKGLQCLPIEAVVYRNSENLGLAKSCNQGAWLARGDCLVFLHNAIEVRPGWLEALLDELAAHPETGVAGGKLLCPDGSVHHAGVAVGPDQIPCSINRGKPADDPLVNERREFPMLTAACAAVRRKEFLDLGGFDEGFINGHADFDLCIRYRRLGQKCVYRPDCAVIHHESACDSPSDVLARDLARTFQKSRYDLVQDDFAYTVRLDSMASPERKTSFAIKIDTPQRGIGERGDAPYAECLARELVRAGHTCVIHYLSEWGSEDSDIDVVIHLKDLSRYYPKPWNYTIMWMPNPMDVHAGEELEGYDAVFDKNWESLDTGVGALLKEPARDVGKTAPLRQKTLDEQTVAHEVSRILDCVRDSKKDTRAWDRIAAARRRAGDPAYRRSGPLVSVLIATYNRRNFLKKSLESIVAQTYADWELWLVNDGGDCVDDIVDAVGDSRIHVINLERNGGKGHALNVAFSHSKGDYIAYNDDDDIWLPDHLERLMLAARELPGVEYAYSDAARLTLQLEENGRFAVRKYELRHQHQVTLSDIMEFNQITGISVLHKRELFTLAGRFDERLKALIDFDMWKRLAALAYPYHVSRITAEYHIRITGKDDEHITSLAQRDPIVYRKQRLRIMRKRLPLPEDSRYHAIQEELYRKTLFGYFTCLCQEHMQKGNMAASDKALAQAEKYRAFSANGLRGLALCYMERKRYSDALELFEEYIDTSAVPVADLFFAYHCALELHSMPHARKYASRIEENINSLESRTRDLFESYAKRFAEIFRERK